MTPFQRRSRAILAERHTPLQGFLGAVVAVAVPTALKFALDSALRGVPPFLTYYPAMTLAALFLGWRWGTAALIASAVICDFFFMPPLHSWSLETNDFVVVVLFVIGGGTIIATAEMLRGSGKRLHAASAREHELNAELKHRVNNTLAIIQALARQTARSSPTATDFYASLSQRLDALREAHDVLSSSDWASCDLPRLAERGLNGYLPNPAIAYAGPACTLPPGSCVPLTLALHELATNATKYGALSTPDGRVSVAWTVEGARLVLLWAEMGGPPVLQPLRKGLGARLLTKQPGLEQVAVEYLPDGLRCTITIHGADPTAGDQRL
jgi:two-component sensor histidine kinase